MKNKRKKKFSASKSGGVPIASANETTGSRFQLCTNEEILRKYHDAFIDDD